jgi:nucleotide-binding universal stress UspA family protein
MTETKEGAEHRIVVGIDGSASATAALHWAMDQARTVGGSVDVVIAWEEPASYGFSYGMAVAMYESDSYEDLAQKVLDGVMADAGTDDPTHSVKVHGRVIQGHPAQSLLTAAKGADLLVLGRHGHGHGKLTGLLLGSVSDHCLRHSSCPVVLVPAPE